MSRRAPDRALKRALADLARLHPDDVQAILGALDPAEKARLDALVAPDAPDPEPVWAYESVSPWLLARIDPEARPAGRRGQEFVLMTEAAREALAAAAAPFRAQKAAPGAARGLTLIDQAWRALTGTRA